MDVRDYNRSVHASKHSTVSENPQPLQLGSLEYPFMSIPSSLENQLIIQEQSTDLPKHYSTRGSRKDYSKFR